MICTFFGHRNAPEQIKPKLKSVLIDLIENQNVNMFYVGNHGAFDRMAREILKDLKEKYDIKYYVVLAYIPKKDEYRDYSDTIYPDEMAKTPYKYRIIERNKWMLTKSDYAVTYVNKIIGGAYELKTLAEKQGKRVVEIS